MPHKDNFVSRELERMNKNIGKIVTLYHQELFMKRPGLGTFCTVSKLRVKELSMGSITAVEYSSDVNFNRSIQLLKCQHCSLTSPH